MKAVWVSAHGGPDVLELVDRPRPNPGPGEVRIRVRAAALNHLDLWVRRGVQGHRFPLPLITGCDGAGEVEALGEGVLSIREGERVAIAPGISCGVCKACCSGRQNLCRFYGIFGETRDGTDAEWICIPEQNALLMPDDMSFVDAAATPLVFLTAWHMLKNRCALQPGETVLVHAAGSGVSMAAIQIARLLGARVLATAGRPEKLKMGLELGAEVVINYAEEDFVQSVRDVTSKRGVDVVVDHVGAENISKSLRCLAKGGRVVTCGATAGPKLESDLRLIFFKSLSLLGSTMGGLGDMRDVWDLVAAGRMRPVVAEVMPLEDVRRAHELLESRAVFGKVVLET